LDMLHYIMPLNPGVIQIANAADLDPQIGFTERDVQDRCIDMHIEALDYAANQFFSGKLIPYGLFKDMLQSIMARRQYYGEGVPLRHYCTAATTNLAVSADGKYYACHMFTNMPKYEVNVRSSETRRNITSRHDHPQCQTCWTRHWCTACVGNFEIMSPGDPKPTRTHCEVTRRGSPTSRALRK